MKKNVYFLLIFCGLSQSLLAQDLNALITRLQNKLDRVNNYVATGKMKTDVVFIKAPLSNIKVYFKKPDRFKIQKNGGISILPKGGVSINMRSVLSMDHYITIDAGKELVDGKMTRKVKLLPLEDSSDIVLTTLFIDEPDLLILKAITTTKDNGTYQMDLTYGRYANYGLPDKVVFSFVTSEYKLPRGVTLEFDSDKKPSGKELLRERKGKIELSYNSYIINGSIPDNVFR